MDPEHVRGIMNGCFDALVPIVERYGGVVDKFIGDEIMALFGAPAAHENDAERALRAALEMANALEGFNTRARTSLRIHFGINTGLAVAGGLGSEGRQQYSMMGDTVNLAARLEDASEAGQILVGPATHRLAASLFDFATMPPMCLKGKSEPVPVYLLTGRKAAPGSACGIAVLRSELIGRDEELARLCAAVEGLAAGRGAVIALAGEPGMGKSRLVAELRQGFPTAWGWAEGRAQSFSEHMSYWIVQRVLDGTLGLAPDTSPGEVAAALRARVDQLFPADQAGEVEPYLARLRELPLDPEAEERLRHVLPEALQQRMRRAFGLFVRAHCQARPLVLVWEDLHWGDTICRPFLPAPLAAGHELLGVTMRRGLDVLAPPMACSAPPMACSISM